MPSDRGSDRVSPLTTSGASHTGNKVTRIWDFERCEQEGCSSVALYRLFSSGFEFFHLRCMAHMEEGDQYPFEVAGMQTCGYRRRQLRSRRTRSAVGSRRMRRRRST